MGLISEDPDLFHCYRRGAYRQLLSAVQKKKHYEINDLLIVGLAYFKLKEFAKSRSCVDFVIERASEENIWAKHARFIRSQLSLVDLDWEGAIVYLEELLCMAYPHEREVSNSLAYVYWQSENPSQAIYHWERVLQMDAENASALNSLGFILADTDTDLPKAHELCVRANQLKSDYSPYLDSFGWTLHKLGQRAKAIYTLRKAMILSPENQEVRRHLSCATVATY